MQTGTDLRIGMLVRWLGDVDHPQEDEIDLGIVVGLPGENWGGCYRIAWCKDGTIADHTPDRLEDSFYYRAIEIVHHL